MTQPLVDLPKPLCLEKPRELWAPWWMDLMRKPDLEQVLLRGESQEQKAQRAVAGGAQCLKCGLEGGRGYSRSYQAALKHSPMVLMGVQQRHLWQKRT